MKCPDGWTLTPLKKMIRTLQAGVSVNSLDARVMTTEQIGVLKTSSVTNGFFKSQENKIVTAKDIIRVKIPVCKDRIILSRMNTPLLVGANAYVHHNYPNLFLPDRLWSLEAVENIVCMRWLGFVLSSPQYRQKLCELATGTSNSMKNISKEDVLGLEVPCPPLPEQQRIADFLGTWDEAIEKLERLIEAKEKHFRTLSVRIFEHLKTIDHKKCTLTGLCTIQKGIQLGKLKMDTNGKFPVLNGGISYSGYTVAYNCEENTITISEGGNSCGFVSFIQEKFWCGGHCYALKNVAISSQYLYFYLKYCQDVIMNLRVGSGLPNIQKKDIEIFEVIYPTSSVKQNKISETLLCVQKELKLLKNKLTALQKQKRGLMQKLLTGTWRV